jgi:hypothetical protein
MSHEPRKDCSSASSYFQIFLQISVFPKIIQFFSVISNKLRKNTGLLIKDRPELVGKRGGLVDG